MTETVSEATEDLDRILAYDTSSSSVTAADQARMIMSDKGVAPESYDPLDYLAEMRPSVGASKSYELQAKEWVIALVDQGFMLDTIPGIERIIWKDMMGKREAGKSESKMITVKQLRELMDAQRDNYELEDSSRLTHSQVGEVFGVTGSNVYQTLHRLKKRLSEQPKYCGAEEKKLPSMHYVVTLARNGVYINDVPGLKDRAASDLDLARERGWSERGIISEDDFERIAELQRTYVQERGDAKLSRQEVANILGLAHDSIGRIVSESLDRTLKGDYLDEFGLTGFVESAKAGDYSPDLEKILNEIATKKSSRITGRAKRRAKRRALIHSEKEGCIDYSYEEYGAPDYIPAIEIASVLACNGVPLDKADVLWDAFFEELFVAPIIRKGRRVDLSEDSFTSLVVSQKSSAERGSGYMMTRKNFARHTGISVAGSNNMVKRVSALIKEGSSYRSKEISDLIATYLAEHEALLAERRAAKKPVRKNSSSSTRDESKKLENYVGELKDITSYSLACLLAHSGVDIATSDIFYDIYFEEMFTYAGGTKGNYRHLSTEELSDIIEAQTSQFNESKSRALSFEKLSSMLGNNDVAVSGAFYNALRNIRKNKYCRSGEIVELVNVALPKTSVISRTFSVGTANSRKDWSYKIEDSVKGPDDFSSYQLVCYLARKGVDLSLYLDGFYDGLAEESFEFSGVQKPGHRVLSEDVISSIIDAQSARNEAGFGLVLSQNELAELIGVAGPSVHNMVKKFEQNVGTGKFLRSREISDLVAEHGTLIVSKWGAGRSKTGKSYKKQSGSKKDWSYKIEDSVKGPDDFSSYQLVCYLARNGVDLSSYLDIFYDCLADESFEFSGESKGCSRILSEDMISSIIDAQSARCASGYGLVLSAKDIADLIGVSATSINSLFKTFNRNIGLGKYSRSQEISDLVAEHSTELIKRPRGKSKTRKGSACRQTRHYVEDNTAAGLEFYGPVHKVPPKLNLVDELIYLTRNGATLSDFQSIRRLRHSTGLEDRKLIESLFKLQAEKIRTKKNSILTIEQLAETLGVSQGSIYSAQKRVERFVYSDYVESSLGMGEFYSKVYFDNLSLVEEMARSPKRDYSRSGRAEISTPKKRGRPKGAKTSRTSGTSKPAKTRRIRQDYSGPRDILPRNYVIYFAAKGVPVASVDGLDDLVSEHRRANDDYDGVANQVVSEDAWNKIVSLQTLRIADCLPPKLSPNELSDILGLKPTSIKALHYQLPKMSNDPKFVKRFDLEEHVFQAEQSLAQSGISLERRRTRGKSVRSEPLDEDAAALRNDKLQDEVKNYLSHLGDYERLTREGEVYLGRIVRDSINAMVAEVRDADESFIEEISARLPQDRKPRLSVLIDKIRSCDSLDLEEELGETNIEDENNDEVMPVEDLERDSDNFFVSGNDISFLCGLYSDELESRLTGGVIDEPDRAQGVINNIRNNIESYKSAHSDMVNSNLRLVVSVAKKYTRRGFPFLDAIQEGNLGLMTAVDRFDPERGYKFSTYSTWWIRQNITRSMADKGRTIRLPVHVVEGLNKLGRFRRQLVNKLGREPSDVELARAAEMKVARVRKLLRAPAKVGSLNVPISHDDESAELVDFIADGKTVPSDRIVEVGEGYAIARDVLRILPARYEVVLGFRNGVDSYAGLEEKVARERLSKLVKGDSTKGVFNMNYLPGLKHALRMSTRGILTLDEIGEAMELTRERVRQLEVGAKLGLQQNRRANRLTNNSGYSINIDLENSKGNAVNIVSLPSLTQSWRLYNYAVSRLSALDTILLTFLNGLDHKRVIGLEEKVVSEEDPDDEDSITVDVLDAFKSLQENHRAGGWDYIISDGEASDILGRSPSAIDVLHTRARKKIGKK